MKINYFLLLHTFFLKRIDSFFNVKTSKNINNINNINSINFLYLKKKTSGCDERYDKTTNYTSLIDFRIQYSKKLSLFYLLKILENKNISNNNKVDFIQNNLFLNDLYFDSNKNKTSFYSYNIYSGGLLNDWDFDF